MGMQLTHIVIIVHLKSLPLKFLLDYELVEIMGSLISMFSIVLAITPVISMKVVRLPKGTHGRGVQESRNSRNRQAKKYLQIEGHMVLRHALLLGG
jgi:hypothetical protein